jgi:Leucine-rich repeat (LRR) protein
MSGLTDVTFFGSNERAYNFPEPEKLSTLTHISFSNFIHHESLDLWCLKCVRRWKEFAQMVSSRFAPSLVPNLTHLTLNECSFIDWPDLQEMSQITHLTINNCEFSKWPDLEKMPKLTNLVVSGGEFPEWPNLCKLKGLTSLHVCPLYSCPSSGSMVCGGKKGFTFPNVEGLPQLRELLVRGHGLISMKIGRLPQLRELCVVGSELSGQIDFSTLPNVTDLWMAGDRFSEGIGSGIGHLKNLERLHVDGTLLAIPETWKELKRLETLDVSCTGITQLPKCIEKLTLKELRLSGRLKNSPSLRFVNQGANVIFG